MYYVVQSLKEYLCCLYTRVQYTYSKQRISKFSGKKGSKYRYSYLFPNFYLTKSIDMALKNVNKTVFTIFSMSLPDNYATILFESSEWI